LRFLVDNQLPLSLSHYLTARGHVSVHVSEVALHQATDAEIWTHARARDLIVVSKDEDFFYLASRLGDQGRLLWIRLGNCRKEALLQAMGAAILEIEACFSAGQKVVELKGAAPNPPRQV